MINILPEFAALIHEKNIIQCPSRNGRFWFSARPEQVFNRPENVTGSPTGIARYVED
jgi:hypothetical protein